jgi:hypothetical protein
MLLVGRNNVCKKNDSHGLWWLEAITKGVLGIFSIPLIFQPIPQIIFKAFNINKIQVRPIY